MGDEKTENTTESDDLDSKIEDIVNKKLNPAITNHFKRFEDRFGKTMQKLVAETLATALPKKEEEEPEAKPVKNKVENDRLAALEKKLADAEKRASETEERARVTSAKSELQSLLEKKGIKASRARALIAQFMQDGALKWDEEGNPVLSVRRQRTKNGTEEEMTFPLDRGVDDWSAHPDAADFLPPKVATKQASQAQRGFVQQNSQQNQKVDPVSKTMQDLGLDSENLHGMLFND